jgi:rhamnogalacturonan endolyase
MANGIVTALIRIGTAQILRLTYDGIQATNGGRRGDSGFYWQGAFPTDDTLVIVADPAANGGNYAEIDLEEPASATGKARDAHRHFSMLRGSPGIYVTAIVTRGPNAPAGEASTGSFTCKLGDTPWNWLAQDGADPRFQAMPGDFTSVGDVEACPKEVVLMTSGSFAGQFECKYDFAGDMGALTTTGWCSTTADIGLWLLHASNEYFASGPMHRDILAQERLINCPFGATHFGFADDRIFAAGETWSKVCGPVFFYFNKVPQGTANPAAALFADALAQARTERSAWPYAWFTDRNYAQASGRGTVTGKIVISDTGNPFASAANLWVGVLQQPPSSLSPPTTDFQRMGKTYQYWTRSDAGGNFTISHVVAGRNYTLFAFGPGAIGQFQSQAFAGAAAIGPVVTNYPAKQFSVTVTGGTTTTLGSVTWTPTRTGNTVWEIGVPDRDTQEFHHGDDYWHGDNGTPAAPAESWAPYLNFPLEWPKGLTYSVGSSHWATDWNYTQSLILDPVNGHWDATPWTIAFNLPQSPVDGAQACIYMGIASANLPIEVSVNGASLGSASGITATPKPIGPDGFSAWYGPKSTDAMIRMSSHGIFCDERITFPGSLLHAGANTITLSMRTRRGYFADSVMYDYLRLELTGYLPPGPSSCTAFGGSGKVCLRWPAAPGATSYNVLRSTTSGTGYAIIASNVTGPVSGSTPDTAGFSDAAVTDGTPYYYVIQSVNSAGAGANSPQASATPLAAAGGPPTVPTNLRATPGNLQVTLTWTPPAGAAFYVILRGSATGGPYTVINNAVATNSFADTGRSNATPYYYVVAAANASGVSPISAEVGALPMPPILTAAPANLTAAGGPSQINLTWTPDLNATNYIIRRATNPDGPYSILSSDWSYGTFVDTTSGSDTTYYYEVAAANLSGAGSFTAPVSLVTRPPAASRSN